MLDFFNSNFGRFLTEQTGHAAVDAQRALSSGHAMKKGGAPQRIASGWAIVRPGTPTMQFELAAAGIEYSKQTRYEAFLAELEHWDGTPRIFIEFDKKPVPVSNLFVTYDPRAVRICSPKGTESFDFTKPPEKDGCKTHKVLWKQKAEVK
jgi:hypothetical protein